MERIPLVVTEGRSGGSQLRRGNLRGPCEVTAAGTFHGRFRIPAGATSGPCRFWVDNTQALPTLPLVIDEFRLNTFDVRLTLPHQRACVAGEPVEGQVAVNYFSGKAAAGAEVEIVAEASDSQPIRMAGKPPRMACSASTCRFQNRSRRGASSCTPPSPTFRGNPTRPPSRSCRCRGIPCPNRAPQATAAGTVVPLEVHATHWEIGRSWGQRSRRRLTTSTGGRDRSRRPGAVSLESGERPPASQRTVVAEGKAVHDECQYRFPRIQPVTIQHDRIRRLESACSNRGWRAAAMHVEIPRRETWLGHRGLFVESDRLLASRVLALPPGEHHIAIPTEKTGALTSSSSLSSWMARDAMQHGRPVTCTQPRNCSRSRVETDKAEYRPGEPCSVVITARDYRGRPVPGLRSAWASSIKPYTSCERTRCPIYSRRSTSIQSKIRAWGHSRKRRRTSNQCSSFAGRAAWGYFSNPLGQEGIGTRLRRRHET